MTILIYPLADGQPAMFAQTFNRRADARDYIAFWRGVGCCRIVREHNDNNGA